MSKFPQIVSITSIFILRRRFKQITTTLAVEVEGVGSLDPEEGVGEVDHRLS
jgi:hypothetical protein